LPALEPVLLLSRLGLSRGQCRSRCGKPLGRPGRADVGPAQAFRRSQLCTCVAQRYCGPAIRRCVLRSAPQPSNGAFGLAGFQEVKLLPSCVTPWPGLGSTVLHRMAPVLLVLGGGLASRDGRQRWVVGAFRRSTGPLVSGRSGPVLLITGLRSMGGALWDRLLHSVGRRLF